MKKSPHTTKSHAGAVLGDELNNITFMLALGSSARSSMVRNQQFTMESFRALIHTPKTGAKDGEYFIGGPVCEGGKRCDADVVNTQVLFIDIDSRIDTTTGEIVEGGPELVEVHRAMCDMDITHDIYSTFSHRYKGVRGRLVVYLREPISNAGLVGAKRGVIDLLNKRGVMIVDVAENHRISQPFYLPRVADEGDSLDFEHYLHDGQFYTPPEVTEAVEDEGDSLDFIIPSTTLNDDGPISRFNAENNRPEYLRGLLENHDYKFTRKDRVNNEPAWRYLSPHSTSGEAGIVVFMANDGTWRVSCQHTSDPLHRRADGMPGAAAHDAFSLKAMLVHRGDIQAALDSIRPAPLTQLGLGGRFARAYRAGLRFVADEGKWMRYDPDSGIWQSAAPAELISMMIGVVQDIPKETGHDPKALFSFVSKSHGHRFMEGAISLAAASTALMVRSDAFDNDVGKLQCRNGLLNLATGELLPNDPDNLMTIKTNVDYDPEATCPTFEETLRDALGDDDAMVEFFHRLVGSSLIGNPREQLLVVIYGPGGNGKSTIMQAIQNAMGDYAKSTSADVIAPPAHGNQGNPNPFLLGLKNTKLAILNESEETGVLKESLTKLLTGGDTLTTRDLYSSKVVSFRPKFMPILATNHLPLVRNMDYALERRIVPVLFSGKFMGSNRDSKRSEKLNDELPGILAWLVAGCKKYRDHGLGELPESVKRAKQDYMTEQDPLSDWLTDCCDIGPGYRASNDSLWESWKRYSEHRGEIRLVPSARSLGRRLSRRFEGFRTKEDRGYQGLRVRPVEFD